MRNTKVDGTEYTVQGPLPSGAFLLTGPRGGELLAVPFLKNRDKFSVTRISGRNYTGKAMWDSSGRRVILDIADLA